jgi:hypothetical protein
MYRNVVAATAHGPTSKNGCARSDYWHAHKLSIYVVVVVVVFHLIHTRAGQQYVYIKSEIDFLHKQSMLKDIRI